MANNKKVIKKKVKEEVIDTSLDVFLILKEKVSVVELQDLINESFKEIETEIWPDLNIMELQLKSDNTMDWIEVSESDVFDDEDKKIINSYDAKAVFCITVDADDTEVLVSVVKAILEKYDGVLGNDTDDFKPMFDKSNIENFNYNE